MLTVEKIMKELQVSSINEIVGGRHGRSHKKSRSRSKSRGRNHSGRH